MWVRRHQGLWTKRVPALLIEDSQTTSAPQIPTCHKGRRRAPIADARASRRFALRSRWPGRLRDQGERTYVCVTDEDGRFRLE